MALRKPFLGNLAFISGSAKGVLCHNASVMYIAGGRIFVGLESRGMWGPPGGGKEPKDANPFAVASREFSEEIKQPPPPHACERQIFRFLHSFTHPKLGVVYTVIYVIVLDEALLKQHKYKFPEGTIRNPSPRDEIVATKFIPIGDFVASIRKPGGPYKIRKCVAFSSQLIFEYLRKNKLVSFL